jgi:hypothetical protein
MPASSSANAQQLWKIIQQTRQTKILRMEVKGAKTALIDESTIVSEENSNPILPF